MLIESAPRQQRGVQSLMYVGDGPPDPPSNKALALILVGLGAALFFARRRRRAKK